MAMPVLQVPPMNTRCLLISVMTTGDRFSSVKSVTFLICGFPRNIRDMPLIMQAGSKNLTSLVYFGNLFWGLTLKVSVSNPWFGRILGPFAHLNGGPKPVPRTLSHWPQSFFHARCYQALLQDKRLTLSPSCQTSGL